MGNHNAWKPYRGEFKLITLDPAFTSTRRRTVRLILMSSPCLLVVRTVEEAADRAYAYVVCAFKSVPEITTTPALLAPLISKLANASPDPNASVTSTFVLLQNGIGIEDDVLEALSAIRAPGIHAVVVSGCCWVDTTVVDEGRKIVQHGNERLVLGYHHPTPPSESMAFSEDVAKKSLGELVELFRAGGSVVEAAPDADVARWRKVLW